MDCRRPRQRPDNRPIPRRSLEAAQHLSGVRNGRGKRSTASRGDGSPTRNAEFGRWAPRSFNERDGHHGTDLQYFGLDLLRPTLVDGGFGVLDNGPLPDQPTPGPLFGQGCGLGGYRPRNIWLRVLCRAAVYWRFQAHVATFPRTPHLSAGNVQKISEMS